MATDVSDDGKTVVGTAGGDEDVFSGFIWSREGGLTDIGIPPNATHGTANAVSGDGAALTGFSHRNRDGYRHGYRWTVAGGFSPLAGSAVDNVPRDISRDGSIVVGYGSANLGDRPQAFRWSDDEFLWLGNLPGTIQSIANGVSADGEVVVGISEGGDVPQAFRWTPATGTTSLSQSTAAEATAVSADGRAIVGRTLSDIGSERDAFRWTAESGMVLLGGGAKAATGTSSDGSVVVGRMVSLAGYDSFIWDAAHGVRSIRDMLWEDHRLDIGDWMLLGAEDVSADGTVIVGRGISPAGVYEGWVATVPEPAFASLAPLAALALLRRWPARSLPR